MPEQYIRTSLVLNDVAEVASYKNREMLIDYNNNFDIYFINDKGEKVSPTKANRDGIIAAIRTHISGVNQHATATSKASGFMSAEDRVLMTKLGSLLEYVRENPYLEIDNVDLGYVNVAKNTYTIVGSTIVFKDFKFQYQGYNFIMPKCIVDLGPREVKNKLSYIYLMMEINDDNIGKLKFTPTIVVKDTLDDSVLGTLIAKVDRYNSSKISPMNPYGHYADVELTSTEIDFMGREIYETQILHFGVPSLPRTDNTVALVNVVDSHATDVITGTLLDKISNYKMSPNGMMLNKSETKGINLPIDITGDFTIEFLIYNGDDQEVINEPIISFNDSVYNSKIELSVQPVSINAISSRVLLISTDTIDHMQLCKLYDGYNQYKLTYSKGVCSVYVNDNMVHEYTLTMDISEAKFLEISSLNVPIGNIRLSKTKLDEVLTPTDIIVGKGAMYPLIPDGYRKLANEDSYIFNSLRIHHSDLGLQPTEDGVFWNVKDSILLYKNTSETISGIYNKKDATTMVTGIKNSNSLFLEDVSGLNIYENIRIVKYNKNLFNIFKIVNIDDTDNSIQIVESVDGRLEDVEIDGSYIYSNIFSGEVIPSIEVKDDSGKILNIAQYPDIEGNVKVELQEKSRSQNLTVSYLLITNYENIIPEYNNIVGAYMDDVECEKLDIAEPYKIQVKGLSVYDKSNKSVKDASSIEYYNPANNVDVAISCDINIFNELSAIRIMEETIVVNMIDSVSVEFELANTVPITVETSEESIVLEANDTLRTCKLSLSCTDKSIVDGVYSLAIKSSLMGESAFVIKNMKCTIDLKIVKHYEDIYRKLNSERIEDMFIVANTEDHKYIKTLINTQKDTTFTLMVIEKEV